MVYFEIDDLDHKIALLQKLGMNFEELPTEKKWLWREARLTDPDKNQLVLYTANENRLNPPWRLSE